MLDANWFYRIGSKLGKEIGSTRMSLRPWSIFRGSTNSEIIYLIGPNFVCPNIGRLKIFVGPNFRHLKISSIRADEYFGPTKFGPNFDFTKTSSYCIMSTYKFSLFTLKNKVDIIFFHISPIFSLKILKNPIFILYFCPKKSHILHIFYQSSSGDPARGKQVDPRNGGGRGGGGDKVWPGKRKGVVGGGGGDSWETSFYSRKDSRWDSWETMFDPRKGCTYKRVTLVRNLVPSITNLYILISLLSIAWSYRSINQINWWSQTFLWGGGGTHFPVFG